LLLTLGKLGTSGFQQLGRQAGGDVREMTFDAVAPRQDSADVLQRSAGRVRAIDDH
jgi:hypothetical protein